jgi:hypothetical protein
MFSFKLPKVREVFSVPNLLDFDKIQPFIYLFIYLSLCFYLAGFYCQYRMTTLSVLLSFLMLFLPTILAFIGKYFTLLLLANCETINISISARNNYSLRNNHFS